MTVSPQASGFRPEPELEGIPQSLLDSYAQYDEPSSFNQSSSASLPAFKDTSHRDDPSAGIAEYADVPEPVLVTPTPPQPVAPAPLLAPEPAAPAPAPAPAVAVPEAPAAPAESALPSSKKVKVKRVWKTNMLFAAAVLAVLAVSVPVGGKTLNMLGFLPSAQAQAQHDELASTVPADSIIESDQQQAIAWHQAHGTFKGYVPLPQAQFTFVGDSAVFGRTLDGVCYVYAVTDGQATVSSQDPTGQGCTPAGIDAAHAQLKQLQ